MSIDLSHVPVPGGPSEEPTMGLAGYHAPSDPAESVALVAASRRERLLGVYRRRLRFEDLEDCYSQATLELLARSRRAPFASPEHIRNALEQKFVSRINDRRRALGGRSSIEAALAHAVPVEGPEGGAHEVEDHSAAVERQVFARSEVRRLREVISELSLDQRLVLHCQVNLGMEVGEFCARYGWSAEKFRKVAQRGRGKLRILVEEYQSGERCRRLEPDLLALAASAGSEEQLRRAQLHVTNCTACARYVRELDRAARDAAALVPIPAALLAGSVAKAGGCGWLVRRLLALVRHPAAEGGGAGSAGIAGGSAVGAGAVKAGVLAVCLAGAAGSYAVCEHVGLTLPLGLGGPTAHRTYHAPTPHHRDGAIAARGGRVRVAPAASNASRSDIAQIRREFGAGKPIRAARAAAAGAATPALASQPATTVNQEAKEFGFER